MAWWRRRNGSDPVDAQPATGAAASPPAPSALPPVQRQAWRDLPPLQRVVTATPAIAPREEFSSALSSWQNPSFLAPLAHLVDPDGPSGHVRGLAGPAAPQPTSPHEDLPVVPRAKVKPDAPVQRLVRNPIIPPATPVPAPQPRFAPAVRTAQSAPSFVTAPEAPVLHRVQAVEPPPAAPIVQRHAGPHDSGEDGADDEQPTGPAESAAPVQRSAAEDVPPPVEALAPTIGAAPTGAAPPGAPESGSQEARTRASGTGEAIPGPAGQPTASPVGDGPATGPAVQRDADPSAAAAAGPSAPTLAASSDPAPALPLLGVQRLSTSPAPVGRPSGLGAPLQVPPIGSMPSMSSVRSRSAAVPPRASAASAAPRPEPAASPSLPRPGRTDMPDVTRQLGSTAQPAPDPEPVGSAPTLGLQRSGDARAHDAGPDENHPHDDPVHPNLAQPNLAHEGDGHQGHGHEGHGVGGSDVIDAIDEPELVVSRASGRPAIPGNDAERTEAPDGAAGDPPLQRLVADGGPIGSPRDPSTAPGVSPPPASAPLLGGTPGVPHEIPGAAGVPTVRRGLGAPLPALPEPAARPALPGVQRSAVPTPGTGSPSPSAPSAADSRVTVRAMSLSDMFAPGEAAVGSGAAVPDGAGSYVFHPPAEPFAGPPPRPIPPSAPSASPGRPLVEMPVAQRFSLPGRDLLSSASSAVGSARSAASNLGDSARSAAGGYVDQARSAAGGYADSARSAATGALDSARSTASSYADSARSTAGGYLDQAQSAAGGYLGSAGSAAGGYLDQARSAAGGALDRAGGAASALGDRASGAVSGLAEQAGGVAQGALGTVQQAAGSVAGQVSDAVGGAADAAGSAASGLMSAASGAAGGLAGAAAGAANALPTDLDELARRLFDPLSARLRNELWMDRERAGLVTDLRR